MCSLLKQKTNIFKTGILPLTEEQIYIHWSQFSENALLSKSIRGLHQVIYFLSLKQTLSFSRGHFQNGFCVKEINQEIAQVVSTGKMRKNYQANQFLLRDERRCFQLFVSPFVDTCVVVYICSFINVRERMQRVLIYLHTGISQS